MLQVRMNSFGQFASSPFRYCILYIQWQVLCQRLKNPAWAIISLYNIYIIHCHCNKFKKNMWKFCYDLQTTNNVCVSWLFQTGMVHGGSPSGCLPDAFEQTSNQPWDLCCFICVPLPPPCVVSVRSKAKCLSPERTRRHTASQQG